LVLVHGDEIGQAGGVVDEIHDTSLKRKAIAARGLQEKDALDLYEHGERISLGY